jgi:Uma2 family endonuclease
MLTVADWNSFPEDDLLRHEIIGGRHYTQRGATWRHQQVMGNLLCDLSEYADERGEFTVHVVGTVLSDTDAVIPDLVYLKTDPHEILEKPYVEVPPDIVIEIVLDETREVDNTVKRELYDRAGVGEYWIVDPDKEAVKILRRAGERLQQVVAEDPITSPLLPGFSLALAKIFA